MRERIILHSDINSCYASIEHLYHPELSGKPLAVGGDPEKRHGIILTADYLAKKYGVKTGMAIWEAKQACPHLTVVPPRMDLYLYFSRLAHEIYSDYTDMIEPYGIDESWLDVTQTTHLFGEGAQIAQKIRCRMKEELGLTVSIGVSFNKIFAKLGSDYKKPDAVTIIERTSFKSTVWKLPVSDLLYVGKSTEKKLHNLEIETIGDLAKADKGILQSHIGKMGLVLNAFANGLDDSVVRPDGTDAPIKSIGNSATTPKNLTCPEDIKIMFYVLAESVGARLRENGLKCNVIEISIRDKDLISFTKQKPLPAPSNITGELAKAACDLYFEKCTMQKPVRSIGIRAASLVPENMEEQLYLLMAPEYRDKLMRLDRAVDVIRKRFGYHSIQRGIMYQDRILSSLNAKEDHVVHPHSFFN